MFNFIRFFFSLLKGIYKTCAKHTQVNRQASVARMLFCRIVWIFWTSIRKILLDTQIKEYNTKLSTKPNTKQYNVSPTPPQLPNLHHNRPLLLLSRNIRSLALTNPTNLRPNYTQSLIHHIITQHSQNDDKYEQIIKQPHTTTVQSQNNHFFSLR